MTEHNWQMSNQQTTKFFAFSLEIYSVVRAQENSTQEWSTRAVRTSCLICHEYKLTKCIKCLPKLNSKFLPLMKRMFLEFQCASLHEF